MLQTSFVTGFAREWIAAWNAHDLDRILAHYTEDIEMSSPLIVKLAGEPCGTLKGKALVRAYWQKALGLLPDLHFEWVAVFEGADSLALQYRSARGLAVEVFYFNAQGYVFKASAHYPL